MLNMIRSVVREHHWSPDQINALTYFDEEDINGLEFWYNDVLVTHAKSKPKPKP